MSTLMSETWFLRLSEISTQYTMNGSAVAPLLVRFWSMALLSVPPRRFRALLNKWWNEFRERCSFWHVCAHRPLKYVKGRRMKACSMLVAPHTFTDTNGPQSTNRIKVNIWTRFKRLVIDYLLLQRGRVATI